MRGGQLSYRNEKREFNPEFKEIDSLTFISSTADHEKDDVLRSKARMESKRVERRGINLDIRQASFPFKTSTLTSAFRPRQRRWVDQFLDRHLD